MRLVINADDFGMTHEKNIAIDQVMKRGICTNASLVVNMPYSKEAADMAFVGGYQDQISMHINLTVGSPLSTEIKSHSLYYDGQNFAYRPIIKLNRQIYPLYIKAVRAELDAQIRQFVAFGFKLKSIDSHNWVHLRLPVWLALKPLIKKYDISVVRPMWDGYKKEEIASAKWAKYFRYIDPVLARQPECRVFEHTSNIEQFRGDEDRLKDYRFVEVFTHPDLIEKQIIDVSSSYLGNPRGSVVDNVKSVGMYPKATVRQIIEEMNQ